MIERTAITAESVLEVLKSRTPAELLTLESEIDEVAIAGEAYGTELFASSQSSTFVEQPAPVLPEDDKSLSMAIKIFAKRYPDVNYSPGCEAYSFDLIRIQESLKDEPSSGSLGRAADEVKKYHDSVMKGFGILMVENGYFANGLLLLNSATHGDVLADPRLKGFIREKMGRNPLIRKAFSTFIAERIYSTQ